MDGKKTYVVKVGDTLLGGEHPVAVQTMWKSAPPAPGTPDFEAALARLASLRERGCAIVRFAAPDLAAAESLGELARRTAMPLVADIHFDWRIALRCLDYPIAKIRLNPGNIGAAWKVAEVAKKAAGSGVPIRVGVNSGSLPKDLAALVDAAYEGGGGDRPSVVADALVAAAERELAELDAAGFSHVLVSMKASDVAATVLANERFAARHGIPLHLGVTEAGPLIPGVARSAVAMHSLLSRGIGATVRVSLSDSCENEVAAGREIVALSTGVRDGVTLVSCPRCGRAGFDTHDFVERWRDRFALVGKPVTIAVMGCVVNGPGEGRHADLGITGAGDKVVVFRKGVIARTTDREHADTVFGEELDSLLGER